MINIFWHITIAPWNKMKIWVAIILSLLHDSLEPADCTLFCENLTNYSTSMRQEFKTTNLTSINFKPQWNFCNVLALLKALKHGHSQCGFSFLYPLKIILILFCINVLPVSKLRVLWCRKVIWLISDSAYDYLIH